MLGRSGCKDWTYQCIDFIIYLCVYIYMNVVIYIQLFLLDLVRSPITEVRVDSTNPQVVDANVLSSPRSTMVRASHLTLPQWFRI